MVEIEIDALDLDGIVLLDRVERVLDQAATALQADRQPIEVSRFLDVQRLAQHDGVAVDEVDRHEADRGVACVGPCRRPRQDIDLARLKGRQALGRVQWNEPCLFAVREHRGGNGSATVDVETGPLSLFVGA